MLKELSVYVNTIKIIQPETKETLTEIKNSLQGINSSVDEAENQVNDLEHKEAKDIQTVQQEKRIKKIEDSVKSLRDSFMHTNIHIIGEPERARHWKLIFL